MYAGKRRRRPAERNTAQPQGEVKSNPSKRHRDRLNAELDRLASLLPFDEDTVSKLDKLSILRLSVSYLRNKSYFQVALNGTHNGSSTPALGFHHHHPEISSNAISSTSSSSLTNCDVVVQTPDSGTDMMAGEAQMSIQALAMGGFIIVVQDDGQIFYATPSIQEHLGFQDADVMHENVYELIHKDDCVDFQQQLNASVSSLDETTTSPDDENYEAALDRNFTCRFRCLIDESSGFTNLHITGKLRPLHGQRIRGEDGVPVDVDPAAWALFAMASPLQQPSIMEIYVHNMIFRTKHELNFKPMSLDAKGCEVLGFTEKELASMAGYHYLHYEDIIYCSDMHSSLIRKGETGFIYFRLMTKNLKWLWVQAKGRVIYKNGKPDYLVSTHRPMSDEEGEQHLNNRAEPFKFPFHGQAQLYDCNPPYPPIPKEILRVLGSGGPPPLGVSRPPGGFPPGGPPGGFPTGPPPDGFPPGGMGGGPPNGMGKPPFSSLGPPPGIRRPPPGFRGPPLGFPAGPMPLGMGVPPAGPPTGKGTKKKHPKLVAKRQLKSPRKDPPPPNINVGPGLEGFNYCGPYERMNDMKQQELRKGQEIRTFTQAFQNVSVQEGLPSSAGPPGEHSSNNTQQPPQSSSIQTVSSCASQVPSDNNDATPGLISLQESQNSTSLHGTATASTHVDHLATDENLEIKKSPASNRGSRGSPLNLTLAQTPDPGYCTDYQESADMSGGILNEQGNHSVQPRSIRNTSQNGHLSTSSETTTSSLPVYNCGEIPCFDDSISPLTLGDMEVMPKDMSFSEFDLVSEDPTADLNKSPLQNSISMSPPEVNLMDVGGGAQQQPQQQQMSPVINGDGALFANCISPGYIEAMKLCGDQKSLQGHNNLIPLKNSPQHNVQNPSCNFVNTPQYQQQQQQYSHLSTSSSSSSLSPQSQNRTLSNTLSQQTVNQQENSGLSTMSLSQPAFKMSIGHNNYEHQSGYQEPTNTFTTQEQCQFSNNSVITPNSQPPFAPSGPQQHLSSCLFQGTQQQQQQLEQQQQLKQQQDELASKIQQQQMIEKRLRQQLQQLQQKQFQSHQLHQRMLQQQQQQQMQMQRQQQELQQQRLLQQKQQQLQRQQLLQQQQQQQQQLLQQQQQLLQQQQLFSDNLSNPNRFSSVPNTQQAMTENGLGSETFGLFEGASTELEIGYGQIGGEKVSMSQPLTLQTSRISMSSNYPNQQQTLQQQQQQQTFQQQHTFQQQQQSFHHQQQQQYIGQSGSFPVSSGFQSGP